MTQHGISVREQHIMDLNDTGLAATKIASRLGLGKDYVRQVIGRYHFGKLGQEMTAIEAATRQSDRLFQRALAASGGRYA